MRPYVPRFGSTGTELLRSQRGCLLLAQLLDSSARSFHSWRLCLIVSSVVAFLTKLRIRRKRAFSSQALQAFRDTVPVEIFVLDYVVACVVGCHPVGKRIDVQVNLLRALVFS